MAEPLQIRVEATPNPNALKISVNRAMWEGRAQTFSTPEQAVTSPLARDLLAVPGVKSVFFLRDFVTISRESGVAWEPIVAQVETVLRGHLD
jgi:hypothetical protein